MPDTRDSPYQGLMPYREDDAPYFFGRERDLRIIRANLFAARLTILYGPTGVGKSSVLRAGLLHQVQAEVEQARLADTAPRVTAVYLSDWQDAPLPRLKAALLNILTAASLGERQDLTASPPLADLLQAIGDHIDAYVMIILDQFEDYFLYHPGPEATAFDAELAAAVNREGLPAGILISIREDAFARLDRFETDIPQLFENYLRLQYLDRDGAVSAIRRPLERYNELVAEPDAHVQIEDRLVDAVIRQVRIGRVTLGDFGGGTVGQGEGRGENVHVETPYLQLVMARLWDEERREGSATLRLATLERLGGADRIVATHLDQALDQLTPAEQDIAARVFYYLVTPSGDAITLRAPDLAAFTGLPEREIVAVLQKLVGGGSRVLRPLGVVTPTTTLPAHSGKAAVGEVRYEIFHDILARPIADWRRRHLAQATLETASTGRKAAPMVLWVDDHPENNAYERNAMQEIGIRFTQSLSTEDALEQLRQVRFAAVISDMGRPGDNHAGYTLLDAMRQRSDATPYIIYAGSSSPEQLEEARRRGALGCTSTFPELFRLVTRAARAHRPGRGGQARERASRR
ncbi:MAG: response regulator [Chloroflexota bacterium]